MIPRKSRKNLLSPLGIEIQLNTTDGDPEEESKKPFKSICAEVIVNNSHTIVYVAEQDMFGTDMMWRVERRFRNVLIQKHD